MARHAEKLKHPHIVRRKGYCGGRPVISGTKFPVSSVVNYVLRQGLVPEELVKEFDHLALAQVYDALAYYYDNQIEIDAELHEHNEEALRPESGR